MNKDKNMSPASRAKSFTYAANGMYQLLRQEPNAKLHAVAAIAALVAGFIKHISAWQWVAILIVIALVWITEAINTCIEKLCDYCCDHKIHPTIKIIKDVAAAAVLIASITALATGVIIFLL